MRSAALLACVLALLWTGACGGGGGQPAGSTKVSLTEYSFQPSQLEVKSGTAVFYLVNTGKVTHNMVILNSAGGRVAKSPDVQAGGESVFSVGGITAGDYKVICDQPGHESSGMVATLRAT